MRQPGSSGVLYPGPHDWETDSLLAHWTYQTKEFTILSQPPGGERLLPLLRQVIQVAISYCAASVIFIVSLIIPKTITVCMINLRIGKGIYGYLFYKGTYISYFTGRSHSPSNQLLDF